MQYLKKIFAIVLVLVMVVGLLPVSAFALTMGSKPDDGTTTGNPFKKGTADSNSFRIPALVTLSDGTLVAAADARWNTTYDGGGLDTIVSRSTDGGDTWNYTFANYLGDNGNTYNGSSSTCFIDPALAVTADDTIYMLVDLYPYGIALNGSGNTAPSTTVGFDSEGRLLLSGNNHSSYGYYLENGKIYSSNGTVQSAYTVDDHFNITGNGYNTNLFFSDSPFKVVRTGFLYLTTSTDGGKKWSAPQLLNLKTSSEQVCLVGPGRGLVTGDDTLVFPVYSYNGSSESQRMSFIYSADGTSWKRSASCGINWSSESAVVELWDGTLRFFYRNSSKQLSYVDYSWESGWGSSVSTGIATNSNCQISAISLQNTIDDQQVILVSCPTGPNGAGSDQSGASYRKNGKIFLFTVDESNAMTQQGSVAVPSVNSSDSFMYSCLTAQLDENGNENGTISILYEDNEAGWGTGDDKYYQMSYKEYDVESAFGVTFDVFQDPEIVQLYDPDTNVEINLPDTVDTEWILTVIPDQTVSALSGTYAAYDITISKDDGTMYTDPAVVILPLGELADESDLYPFIVESDGSVTQIETFDRDDDLGTIAFTAPHFSVMGLAVPVEEEVPTGEDTVTSSGGQTTTSTTEYILDTDGVDTTGEYLIVNSSSNGTHYALTNNSGNSGSTAVTVTSSKAYLAEGTSDANLLWTFSGSTSGTVGNNGRYVYPERSSLSLNTNGTNMTISNQGNGAYRIFRSSGFSRYYLRYNSNWTGSTSSSSVYLFKKTVTTTTVDTRIWTVDPALQENRIRIYTVENDNYTDESWAAYQSALTAAQNKLVEVKDAEYKTEADANEALADLITAVDALEAAKDALKKAVTITINYQANGVTVKTEKMRVAEDAASVTLPATITSASGTTYTVDDTTLKLTKGTTTYNVSVTERVGTPITIKENETKELSVQLSSGQYVQWSTDDPLYVGVAGKYDADAKAYTDTGIIIGHQVTDEPVIVTGTVYNADGTVAAIHKWLVTVTEGDADTNTSEKHIYVNVKTLENCTAYYSFNGGELIQINGTGILLDSDITGRCNLMFFAAPNEGYALTYMSVSGSALQYYTISDGNPDGTGSEAWPFDSATQTTIPSTSDDSAWVSGHGLRWPLLEGNMSIEQMKILFSQAIALGCDGLTSFTKNGTASYYTELQFAAQKLPTMDKQITSISRADGTTVTYTEGMKLDIGDTINYKITITEYPEATGDIYDSSKSYTVTSPINNNNKPTYKTGSYGTITYSNTSLRDELTGNYNIDTTPDWGDSANASGVSYDTSITLSAANFLDVVVDGKITNVAELSYDYKSEYSKGSLTASSQAVAEILVEAPEYVIDFGQSVMIDLSGDLANTDSIQSATARYGTVSVSGKTLTYTPNTILPEADFITLKFRASGSLTGYGVRVYPATTVYYEEVFLMAGSSGWSTGSKATASQTAEELGQKANPYGFDPIYDGITTNGEVTESSASATTAGASTSFTFTGTGFELYADCTADSGYVSVDVRNGANQSVKMFMVDTKVLGGTTDATKPQAGDMDALPIVSVKDLPHGTYTVKMTKVMNDGKSVNIDGVRIINTLADSSVFAEDLEDNPEFYELRDMVLHAVGVGSNDAEEYKKLQDKSQQIFDDLFGSGDSETPVAVITDPSQIYGNDAEIQDLLDNGPKNELYLWAGQTLTFNVSTKRCMQVGLKAPSDATSYTLKVNGTVVGTEKTALAASVDLFYDLVKAPTTAETVYTVSITNTGSKVLSVTDLKICDDPSAAFVALTEEDICGILEDAGYTDPSAEHVCPSANFVDVAPDQWFHEAVDFVVEKGLMNGMSKTVFNPEGNMNRAQIVTVLYRLAGSPDVESASSFTDVPADSFYGNAVAWAVSNGITNGTSATTFNPSGDVTREQMVTFLYRYVKSTGADLTTTGDLNGYTDASAVSSWAVDAFIWAVENGIISGMTADTLVPGATTNRAQVATVLMRFVK